MSGNDKFNFDKITTMPNSFNAHILIEFSKEQNLQNKISEELFNAFFIEGKNIGENNILLELANKNNILNFSKQIFTERKDLIEKMAVPTGFEPVIFHFLLLMIIMQYLGRKKAKYLKKYLKLVY